MSQANILTDRQTCARECSSTWRHEHGASVPGGPFPGTMAEPGDVRRCEHGKYWQFDRTSVGTFFTTHDLWRRLHPMLSPIAYVRARKALNADVT